MGNSQIETETMKYLDAMADKYATEKAHGPDAKQMEYVRRVVISKCKGPKVLELGYGSGYWTKQLMNKQFDVTIVEGSAILVKHCEESCGGRVRIVHSLFEKFQTQESYNSVIAAFVLEHVDEPAHFLSLIRSWLDEKGSLHIVVPNALSLHRRIGLKMKMLSHQLELSPQELEVGHKRAYTKESLKKEIEEAGLQVNFTEGIFVKPLSSGQMMDWSNDLFDAYNELSDELPDYTAFIYANCSKL